MDFIKDPIRWKRIRLDKNPFDQIKNLVIWIENEVTQFSFFYSLFSLVTLIIVLRLTPTPHTPKAVTTFMDDPKVVLLGPITISPSLSLRQQIFCAENVSIESKIRDYKYFWSESKFCSKFFVKGNKWNLIANVNCIRLKI